jgi:hypothetical protein
MADNHSMKRKMTVLRAGPIQAGYPQYSGVQFQLSLLRLMDPGSLPSPQAAQLERLNEPAALVPAHD